MANSAHIETIRTIPSDPTYSWARGTFNNLDLSGADLRGCDLRGLHIYDCDFTGANLDEVIMAHSQFNNCKFLNASLRGAHLGSSMFDATTFAGADLQNAYLAGEGRFLRIDFRGADLRKVTASWVDFQGSIFDGANMRGAILQQCEMRGCTFIGSTLNDVELMNTSLTGVNLTGAIGLDEIRHRLPSPIDHRTIQLSSQLPIAFLRGCGLPDEVIDFYLSIPGAIFFNSCFISYADSDRPFSDRLYADLQAKGIRAYYAPESLRTGDRLLDALTEAIQMHDKLLVVLSANSLSRPWVKTEVEKAMERERNEGRNILFPIMLDDEVLSSKVAWAGAIRQRQIGDFRGWTNPDTYRVRFERLVGELRPTPP